MTPTAEWERIASTGDVVSAVKAYRAATGVGLADAERTVERWLDVTRPPSVAYQRACRIAGRVVERLDEYQARAGRAGSFCVQVLSAAGHDEAGQPTLLTLDLPVTDSHSGFELIVFVELEEVPGRRERAAARAALGGGAKLVWVLQPAVTGARVEAADGRPARVLFDTATLDGGDVLPGFACKVSDLFA